MRALSTSSLLPLRRADLHRGVDRQQRHISRDYQYDPYGNLTSSTGSVANPWRFAAGYFDSSTGLYKFGTRYYNPGFGRWSQQDPVRGQLKDPTSLNRSLYAGDDPVNFVDPSGRDFWSDWAGCLGTTASVLIMVVPAAVIGFIIALCSPDLGLGCAAVIAPLIPWLALLVAGIVLGLVLYCLGWALYDVIPKYQPQP